MEIATATVRRRKIYVTDVLAFATIAMKNTSYCVLYWPAIKQKLRLVSHLSDATEHFKAEPQSPDI